MKIVILGAGQVGSTVASALVHEDNDITIVDIDERRLKELQDQMDIRGVLGHASHPRVMERAGIEDADLVIALTSLRFFSIQDRATRRSPSPPSKAM
jgi:trk system potassium uptake protein TrkA